jgi:hypothetical protein
MVPLGICPPPCVSASDGSYRSGRRDARRMDGPAARRRVHERRGNRVHRRAEWIIRIFTNDAAVLQTGVALLGVAAVFQLRRPAGGDRRAAWHRGYAHRHAGQPGGHWLLGPLIGYAPALVRRRRRRPVDRLCTVW